MEIKKLSTYRGLNSKDTLHQSPFCRNVIAATEIVYGSLRLLMGLQINTMPMFFTDRK